LVEEAENTTNMLFTWWCWRSFGSARAALGWICTWVGGGRGKNKIVMVVKSFVVKNIILV
jgi:hypothetical protein